MENFDVEAISCLTSGKKRKFDTVNTDVNDSTSPTATASVTSVYIPTSSSQCSSCYYESNRNLKSLDLKVKFNKAEAFETDKSASFNGAFSENYGDSEEIMEISSATAKKSASVNRKPPSAVKIPPEAEIEEFFSAAEKREQKRFAEKYNYDIVKDVPLEGRYQWVSLKP